MIPTPLASPVRLSIAMDCLSVYLSCFFFLCSFVSSPMMMILYLLDGFTAGRAGVFGRGYTEKKENRGSAWGC